jgi:tRNA-specific 2-thiouridylase
VAAKPDSQDICFVPDGSYDRLVAKLRPETAEAATSWI